MQTVAYVLDGKDQMLAGCDRQLMVPCSALSDSMRVAVGCRAVQMHTVSAATLAWMSSLSNEAAGQGCTTTLFGQHHAH